MKATVALLALMLAYVAATKYVVEEEVLSPPVVEDLGARPCRFSYQVCSSKFIASFTAPAIPLTLIVYLLTNIPSSIVNCWFDIHFTKQREKYVQLILVTYFTKLSHETFYLHNTF